jgi:hypothetical protein
MPEMIPPTPESVEITERAVRSYDPSLDEPPAPAPRAGQRPTTPGFFEDAHRRGDDVRAPGGPGAFMSPFAEIEFDLDATPPPSKPTGARESSPLAPDKGGPVARPAAPSSQGAAPAPPSAPAPAATGGGPLGIPRIPQHLAERGPEKVIEAQAEQPARGADDLSTVPPSLKLALSHFTARTQAEVTAPARAPGDGADAGLEPSARVEVESPAAPAAKREVRPRPDLDEIDLGPGTVVHPAQSRPARSFEAGSRVPLKPAWPAAAELVEPDPFWKRPWVWGVGAGAVLLIVIVAVLLAGRSSAPAKGGVGGVLRGLGLGGDHFAVKVTSVPEGAWISVNGEDMLQRTPASIDLAPGEHEVKLSFADHGSASFKVRGVDGDQQTLEANLWGSLEIYSSDTGVPVAVAVDGQSRGFAPVSVDSLSPGAHEVRFSGPGLPSWGQTVLVRVQETSEVVARPMSSPATGLIEVRAELATSTGADDLEGAEVWVDGRSRGVTPLSLELPRGPHSVRVSYNGESSPVQVIDLPGGNQRFAHFQLGFGGHIPSLSVIDPPAAVALDRPSMISVALDGVTLGDVKDMWLHVETPDQRWRRYELALIKAPGGVVGTTVFPNTLFDGDGLVRFYASARTHVGDEYFTEIQRAKSATPPKRATPGR